MEATEQPMDAEGSVGSARLANLSRISISLDEITPPNRTPTHQKSIT